jgi:hypothetical protein
MNHSSETIFLYFYLIKYLVAISNIIILQIMRNLFAAIILGVATLISNSQIPNQILTSKAAEDNLNRILKASPTRTGTLGFDNRFEGVKGSPNLFEKLLPSFMKISGSEEYFKLNSDLNIYENNLIFTHPKTGQLLSLPSDFITEVIVTTDIGEQVFRTTAGCKFEKEFKEIRFFQVLKDGPWQFIKMPVKELVKADFKNAYSPDRRYDEFQITYKYYIKGSDGIFHPLLLNKKALIKLFPDKKKLIESGYTGSSIKNDEAIILNIIGRF